MASLTNASLVALCPLLLLSVTWLVGASGANQNPTIDVLDPPTLTDAEGNKADADSNIDFVHSKGGQDQDYKAGNDVPATIAMASWFYDMSTAIASSAMSGDFPYELVSTLSKDGVSKLNPVQTVKDFMGLVVAIAFGVILLLVVPIAGCCFCCCRCNRRCGGRRRFNNPYEAGYKAQTSRRVTIGFFSVFLLFAIVGTVLMTLANHNLTTQLYDINNGGLDKLDDVETFLNDTIDQAESAIFGKYNFTVEVMSRDLANIGFLVGQPVKSYVLTQSGLEKTFDDILDLEQDAKAFVALLNQYNSMRPSYMDKTDDIATAFAADPLKAMLDKSLASGSFKEGSDYNDLMTYSRGLQIENLEPRTNKIQGFLDNGISSIVDDSKSTLNDVPEKIKSETESTIEDIEKQFSEYRKDMQSAIDDLKTLRNDVVKSYRENKAKESTEDVLDTVTEYDRFRWYGGIGLAVLAFIADILLLLAVSFGIFGGNAEVAPDERSKLSNRGGNLLLGGSIFAFISAWFLILLTIPMFLIGAPVNTFACGPIQDPSVLDKLLNQYDLMDVEYKGNGTWLGDQIFPGEGVDMKLATLLSVCSSGGTIYKAFQADPLDLDKLADFNKTFDIDAEFSKFNVDFSGTTMDYTEVEDFMDSLSDVIMFTNEIDKLVDMSLLVATENFESYLTTRSQNTSDSRKIEMGKLLQALQAFKPTALTMEPEVTLLRSISPKYRAITDPPSGPSLTNKIDSLKNQLVTIGDDLSTATKDAFKKGITDFANRMRHIFDQSANGLTASVKSEIGMCKPLYNIYDDLLRKSTCDYIVGSLVAWACAMGMTSVSLLLTLCVSCTLSKHLYRVEINDEAGNGNNADDSNFGDSGPAIPSAPPAYHIPSSGNFTTAQLFNNKVYHADSLYPVIDPKVPEEQYYGH